MAKKRIQVAKTGEFLGHPQGPYTLTADDLARMVANHRREAVIDYEHASHFANGEPTPAAGWVKGLELEGEILYANVEWTKRAEEMIDAGEYRYVSPVIDPWAVDPATGHPVGISLTDVGLTNSPFMSMEGIQNTIAKGDLQTCSVTSASIKNRRHNTENLNDESMSGQPQEGILRAFMNRLKGVMGSQAEDEFGLLDDARQLKMNSQRITDLETKVQELTTSNQALNTAKAEAETKLEAMEAQEDERILNSAVSDFRVANADLEGDTGYRARIKKNRTETRAILNALPKNTVKPNAKIEEPGDKDPKLNKGNQSMKDYIKGKRQAQGS